MSLNLLCTTKLGKCKLTGPLRVFNMNNELKCRFHDFAYLPLPNIWVFRIHSSIVYYISQTEFHLIDHIENLSMYFNQNNTICVIYVTEIFDKVGCYRHMLLNNFTWYRHISTQTIAAKIFFLSQVSCWVATNNVTDNCLYD